MKLGFIKQVHKAGEKSTAASFAIGASDHFTTSSPQRCSLKLKKHAVNLVTGALKTKCGIDVIVTLDLDQFQSSFLEYRGAATFKTSSSVCGSTLLNRSISRTQFSTPFYPSLRLWEWHEMLVDKKFRR